MKLNAYSDDDGFIHYNVVAEGNKSIWHKEKGEWLKREKDLDVVAFPSWLETFSVILLAILVFSVGLNVFNRV